MVISGIDAKIKAWTPPTFYKFQDNIISSDHATTKPFIPSYEKYVFVSCPQNYPTMYSFIRTRYPKHAYLCILIYTCVGQERSVTQRANAYANSSRWSRFRNHARKKYIIRCVTFFLERDARASSYYCRTSINEFGGEKNKFGKRQSFQKRVRKNYYHEW